MDVGYYIGELLRETGEVKVPGLGSFRNTRTSGHYDETEGVIYPPGNRVQFHPQPEEDDTLAAYLADKESMSLPFAGERIQKYVDSIVQASETGETPLSSIGWLSGDQDHLSFRQAEQVAAGVDFFGYPPVRLHKLGSEAIAAPVNDHPAGIPVTSSSHPPAKLTRYQSKLKEEESKRRKKERAKNNWITALVALLLAAVITYALYRYEPDVFSNITSLGAAGSQIKVLPKDSVAAHPSKKDTPAVNVPAVADTAARVAVTDSLAYPYFELMGGSFNDSAEANKAIRNYKKLGINAKIVKVVPLKKVNVSIGTYKTRGEAYTARHEMIRLKKIKSDIYPLEVKKK